MYIFMYELHVFTTSIFQKGFQKQIVLFLLTKIARESHLVKAGSIASMMRP